MENILIANIFKSYGYDVEIMKPNFMDNFTYLAIKSLPWISLYDPENEYSLISNLSAIASQHNLDIVFTKVSNDEYLIIKIKNEYYLNK